MHRGFRRRFDPVSCFLPEAVFEIGSCDDAVKFSRGRKHHRAFPYSPAAFLCLTRELRKAPVTEAPSRTHACVPSSSSDREIYKMCLPEASPNCHCNSTRTLRAISASDFSPARHPSIEPAIIPPRATSSRAHPSSNPEWWPRISRRWWCAVPDSSPRLQSALDGCDGLLQTTSGNSEQHHVA